MARVTRFPIRADGSLGVREKCGPDLGMEFARDGIAFDEAGNSGSSARARTRSA